MNKLISIFFILAFTASAYCTSFIPTYTVPNEIGKAEFNVLGGLSFKQDSLDVYDGSEKFLCEVTKDTATHKHSYIFADELNCKNSNQIINLRYGKILEQDAENILFEAEDKLTGEDVRIKIPKNHIIHFCYLDKRTRRMFGGVLVIMIGFVLLLGGLAVYGISSLVAD